MKLSKSFEEGGTIISLPTGHFPEEVIKQAEKFNVKVSFILVQSNGEDMNEVVSYLNKSVQYLLILFTGALIFAECDNSSQLIENPASYIASIEQWQKERLEGLKGKNGWLNLAGIYWLNEGVQTLGSDSTNDIVFPAKAPAFIGSLSLKDSLVRLTLYMGVLPGTL